MKNLLHIIRTNKRLAPYDRGGSGLLVFFLRILTLLFWGAVGMQMGWAQISPGPLSQAHAELEGIRNCTQCHDLGSQVSSAKCLVCHEEIQTLVDANRGLHAAAEVRRQECFECHSEHHGKRFDQTRFDQDNFDHDLTGYELEGQHDVIDCRECHKPDYIADSEIRSRQNTFLGLDQECLACHDDYHQQTLSEDCASCHNFEAFSPAPGFDHEETEYPLRGAHVEVDCIECHQKTTRNGAEYQEFSGIEFNDCIACHDDAHNRQLPGACAQCHTVQSWESFIGQRRFNHSRTSFELLGSHKQVACFACHTESHDPLDLFQDQNGIAQNECISCHEDHHEGLYGKDCARCHQEESWLALKDMSFFDHSVTDYPLEGLHQEVDCRECHTDRFSTPIDFSQCQNCHENYHRGEFAVEGLSPDCVVCHSLEEGFAYSLFSLEQHQETSFPLEGAHIATPCFACHIDEAEDRWTFRQIGETCVDCHENIHKGYISDSYYPEEDCRACHSSHAWDDIAFDHDLTGWTLDGKHAEIACRECHYEAQEGLESYLQVFQGLEGECVSCHENVHGDEFAVNGVTVCTECHVTNSWVPELFDHDQTRFPLEGRHAEIECAACHEVESEEGTPTIVYKLNKLQCIDCHQ